jgi:hypothetical protein
MALRTALAPFARGAALLDPASRRANKKRGADAAPRSVIRTQGTLTCPSPSASRPLSREPAPPWERLSPQVSPQALLLVSSLPLSVPLAILLWTAYRGQIRGLLTNGAHAFPQVICANVTFLLQTYRARRGIRKRSSVWTQRLRKRSSERLSCMAAAGSPRRRVESIERE